MLYLIDSSERSPSAEFALCKTCCNRCECCKNDAELGGIHDRCGDWKPRFGGVSAAVMVTAVAGALITRKPLDPLGDSKLIDAGAFGTATAPLETDLRARTDTRRSFPPKKCPVNPTISRIRQQFSIISIDACSPSQQIFFTSNEHLTLIETNATFVSWIGQPGRTF